MVNGPGNVQRVAGSLLSTISNQLGGFERIRGSLGHPPSVDIPVSASTRPPPQSQGSYTYTGKCKGRAQALLQDLGEYGGQTSAIAMPQLSYVSASIFTSRDTNSRRLGSDLDLYKRLPGTTSAHTAPMATENPSEACVSILAYGHMFITPSTLEQ